MEKIKTIWDLNKIAKEYGLKLVAGKGYYYWTGITEETRRKTAQLPTTSVYIYRFSHFPFDRWVNEELELIKKKLLDPEFYSLDTSKPSNENE